VLDVAGAFEYSVSAVLAEGGKPPPSRVTDQIKRERELADFLFVPSAFVEACLVENGVPLERIVRIPYGVDASLFAPSGRADDRPFRALFAGRIGLRKGVSYLLEAWSSLRLPHADLVLLGSPDAYGSELMRRHAGRYRHVPQVPLFDLYQWFDTSDIFVFPSLSEGSALVTYMALAAGLPLITTMNSGSVLRHGIEGFLVPPRDAQALAQRIRDLYDDTELRHGMGVAARQTVIRSYTWGHYRLRIASAYRAILDGRDPRTAIEPRVPVS
jgi:glycosyltransferase involved in cell wall biosynthesis